MSKLLVAGVVNQDPETLQAHVETLQRQSTPIDGFYFRVDPEAPDSNIDILPGEVEIGHDKPDESAYAVDETTHNWNEADFDWLARERQEILNYAIKNHFDHVALVDSDLLLSSDTLESMLDCNCPIVSAVFWTDWQPGSHPLPQVWLDHPYKLEGRGVETHEFLDQIAGRKLTQVWGLGACTLISTDVLDRVLYYPRLDLPEGGMMRGEDRSFCIRAERAHIPLYADPWPDIYHVYRPSDRENIGLWLDELENRIIEDPGWTDLVNFSVEPLEEPGLAGVREICRGTLGQIEVLPEIREALLDMSVHESRIVNATFPPWWPEMLVQTEQGFQDIAPQYRNSTRKLRIRLLGARKNYLHPRLEHNA